MNPDLPSNENDALKSREELRKITAEADKAEFELIQQKKIWFRKSSWWAALAPWFIGILTIWVGYKTKFFEVQAAKNDAKIKELSNQKLVLQGIISELDTTKAHLTDSIYLLKSELSKMDLEKKEFQKAISAISKNAKMTLSEQAVACAHEQAKILAAMTDSLNMTKDEVTNAEYGYKALFKRFELVNMEKKDYLTRRDQQIYVLLHLLTPEQLKAFENAPKPSVDANKYNPGSEYHLTEEHFLKY